MDQQLLRPKWVLAHVAVAALVGVFIALGLWQLDRLEERRAENALIEARYLQDPVPFESLSVSNAEEAEYRRVQVTGVFLPDEEVLIRSQVYRGTAGFHVVTPMVTSGGEAVLVNRGWVPLTADDVPVNEALPNPGESTITGWIHPTQLRPPLGREEPPGDLDVLNRIDIARIQEQVPVELANVYVVDDADGSEGLPIPVGPPDFTDEGSHFGYAFQWFGFALITAVGYFFFARRQTQRRQPGETALASSSTTS